MSYKLEGSIHGGKLRMGVVVAKFNEFITSRLLEGVESGLTSHGVSPEDITVAWVPGTFEIPLIANRMAGSGNYDAVICTDVLEHIPESDLGWVVDEIFSYATKMIFINVACFKALKHFEDGTNVHISVFTPEYWIDFLTKKSRNFRNIVIYLFADVLIKRHEDSDKITFVTKGFKIDHYPRIQELGEQE